MRASAVLAVLVALATSVLVAAASRGTNSQQRREVMPWLCLELCGGNASSIASDLASLRKHTDVIDIVSFEGYHMDHGQLLRNPNVTDVVPQLRQMGFRLMPLISSFPYPPEFLTWMRELFQSPDEFIMTAVKIAQDEGFEGWNVDFEPTVRGTHDDAVAYSAFLDKFAKAMHAVGKRLSVDISLWNPIWNMPLLANTSLDAVVTMQTYTDNFTIFEQNLQGAVQNLPLSQLQLGLCTACDKPLLEADLATRIQMALLAGVRSLGVWDMPIPDLWWPYLELFVRTPMTAAAGGGPVAL